MVSIDSPSSVALSPTSDLCLVEPSPIQLRVALGRFATGVTVVTTRAADGHLVGLTASSFNSVSLNPPLVLWSLACSSASMSALTACSHYAINVLSADQLALAERFAAKGIDRWAGVSYQEGCAGIPILDGAIAVFECANRSRYAEGDHVIFVGEVQRCVHRRDAPPLIYCDGRLHTDSGL